MIPKKHTNVNKTHTNVNKTHTNTNKIIQKCKDRHENPILTPFKTIRPRNEYHVSYAKGRTCNPADFKAAGIGIIPCGYYDTKGKFHANSPERYGQDSGKNWNTCYGVRDWKPQSWFKSHGIQVYTGKPSNYLTELDFEYAIIRDHPERTAETLSRLCKLTPNPFLIITKSGGLRFSCHTPGYIHPNPKAYREYIATWISHNKRKDLYLEIFGEKGLSRYDARYEIVEGSIFEIPTIDHTALFEIINDLRDQIGEPRPESPIEKQKDTGNHTKASQPPKITQTIDVENYNIDVTSLTFTNNRSRVYPTALCPATNHKNKQALAVQFYKHDNGAVNGYCHNCSSHWWIIPPSRAKAEDLSLIEIREEPSYPYWTSEARQVVETYLDVSSDAGWIEQTPIWTPKYEYLHPLTNKFAMNGQPTEIERRRVWSTLLGKCYMCGAPTANWIDRYLLKAGYYCDGCHKDYPLGSYLELELNRKLDNSIVSDFQGYIEKDPNFTDFRLWQPLQITHLAGAMGTGKTTTVANAIRKLATEGIGLGIIAVPRISLARFLAHHLRQKDGTQAWGLWHQGAKRRDKFIGSIGAIVCLPSLPAALKQAEDCQFHIAIDEIDFSYRLLGLAIEQATAVKKCLRDNLHKTGLVLCGQTESTLALEALIEEFEPEDFQGFYNTATPAPGTATIHNTPQVEGKQNMIIAGVIEKAREVSEQGKKPYIFCSSRRDAHTIAEIISDMNPLIYDAYTKLYTDCDALLYNQGLTEKHGAFVATSAAAVGISINDPHAYTIIAERLNHGTRDISTIAQEAIRDRGRRGVDIYTTDYELRLPLAPRENENVSLYHEKIKQQTNPDVYLSTGAIKKVARAQALQSLADHQPEVFLKYHLGTITNMEISETSLIPPKSDEIEKIRTTRTNLLKAEKKAKIEKTIDIFKRKGIKPASVIRSEHIMTPVMRIAHELANKIAVAIGWDEERELSEEETTLATQLVQAEINPDALSKHRRAYLAIHHRDFVTSQFANELLETTSDQINKGEGKELTAIRYDLGIADILIPILDSLQGKVFTQQSLATVVRSVLNTPAQNNNTLLSRIQAGEMGSVEYRHARFLHCVGKTEVLNWTKRFLFEWYPVRIAKRGDSFALNSTKDYHLRVKAFGAYLKSHGHDCTSEKTEIDTVDLPDPEDALKNKARQMRYEGEELQAIADEFGKNKATISRWCEGVKTPLVRQKEIVLRQANYSISPVEMHKELKREYGDKTVSYRTVLRWMEN